MLVAKFDIRCCFCNKKFTSSDFPNRRVDRVTIHHIDGNHKNNDPSNLALAHRTCHKAHHLIEQRKKRGEKK